ncbi:MAG TPA: DnaJ family domain-containing protein [Burkholderiaceae bacterium]|jgi:hypothetical protein|nr:DnaJ family domain-containing protein [Burkholderiaceae bacterium]
MELPSAFAAIVERRIAEAIARGEFDHLPGAGKPLALDDDPLVPDELRVAYRILKNAGFVPPELEHCAEIGRLLAAIESEAIAPDGGRAGKRLRALLLQLEASGRHATAARAWHEYEEALARRLGRGA